MGLCVLLARHSGAMSYPHPRYGESYLIGIHFPLAEGDLMVVVPSFIIPIPALLHPSPAFSLFVWSLRG